MATVQDQEKEHHRRFDHGSRGNEESSHCDDGAWGPQGCSRGTETRESSLPSQTWMCHWLRVANRDTEQATRETTKYLGPNAQKTTGRVGAWKPSYLQVQPGSTCCREEHVESGSSSVWGYLAAATQSLNLQIISKDEQLRLDAAAVVEDLLLSWAPLHSGLGHDAPVFKTTRRKTAQVQAYALPRCQLHEWHSGGQRQLEAWFQEQRATMPEQ